MTQQPLVLKNNIDHLSKQGPPTFFHLDTNPVLSDVLVHSVEKTHVLVVTGELIWLLFLNILFFNYVQMLSKSHRFRKFRRNYVHLSVFVQPNHREMWIAFFLLDRHCWKRPYFLFCCCLSVTIVHLHNLFLLSIVLLSIPVAQVLLAPRWKSRRKDVE